jgi:hypothetical protein
VELRRYGRESVRATGDYYKHRKGDDQRAVSSEAERPEKQTKCSVWRSAEDERAADCSTVCKEINGIVDCCSHFVSFKGQIFKFCLVNMSRISAQLSTKIRKRLFINVTKGLKGGQVGKMAVHQ